MNTCAMTDGQIRVVIANVRPEIEHGRFPVKRTVGEKVVVEADVFTDGHDALAAVLLYRHEKGQDWRETPLLALVNDQWRGEFIVSELGRYVYTVHAWVDHFTSWRRALGKKVEARQDVAVDLLVGAQLLGEASTRAAGQDAENLREWARALQSTQESSLAQRIQLALAEEVASLAVSYPDRRRAATYDKELIVIVDREKARYSAWYEMFP